MENKNQLQVQTSSNMPALKTAKDIATIRLHESAFPRYQSVPERNRQEWLAAEVRYLASVTRTRDFDMRDSVLTAAVLDEMLLNRPAMADLTFPELHDAFNSGVFGLLGDFYGLSAPTLFGFVNKFLASDKKKEAATIVAEQKKRQLEKEKEQRAIREEIEKAKADGSFVPTGQAWFQPKKVKDAVDSTEHQELIRRQREEIFKQYGHGTD